MRTAIQNAVNENIVLVFAAGNFNENTDNNPMYPGVYPEVIAVAALDQLDQKADRPTWGSNFGTNVDVSAPGVNVWSTARFGGYRFLEGTSMATPHASGVAALVWSVNRNLTNEEVRQVIEDTCDDIDAANPGFVGMLGRGRVNAFQAVSRATGAISMSGALSQLLEPNKDISGALSSVLE